MGYSDRVKSIDIDELRYDVYEIRCHEATF
jgi:hypothetical protein